VIENALYQYKVPSEYKKILESTKSFKDVRLPGLTPKGLTKETYKNYFQSLMWVEELQMEDDIKKYGMSYR
jgi:hypothetical protein